jgi:hypothetical protein
LDLQPGAKLVWPIEPGEKPNERWERVQELWRQAKLRHGAERPGESGVEEFLRQREEDDEFSRAEWDR